MKILALETSSLAGSVALLEDDVHLHAYDLPGGQRTAQSFAPAIKQQLDKAAWRPSDIDLIAVTQGPGSFTGLRVGVTAAKTLAYAVRAQVIGVNTLHVIAAQASADDHLDSICAAINAQRGELFVARFRPDASGLPEVLENPRIVPNESWLSSLDATTLVIGPGLGRLSNRIPSEVRVAHTSQWNPRASTVGLIGYRRFQSGVRHDLWQLAPQYYRKSAAEEKWESARD